jgi:hypothetical protein
MASIISIIVCANVCCGCSQQFVAITLFIFLCMAKYSTNAFATSTVSVVIVFGICFHHFHQENAW